MDERLSRALDLLRQLEYVEGIPELFPAQEDVIAVLEDE